MAHRLSVCVYNFLETRATLGEPQLGGKCCLGGPTPVKRVVTCNSPRCEVMSARASRAGDRALAIANFASIGRFREFSAGAPKSAREARALPGLRRSGNTGDIITLILTRGMIS